jgi:hypothetical protein
MKNRSDLSTSLVLFSLKSYPFDPFTKTRVFPWNLDIAILCFVLFKKMFLPSLGPFSHKKFVLYGVIFGASFHCGCVFVFCDFAMMQIN